MSRRFRVAGGFTLGVVAATATTAFANLGTLVAWSSGDTLTAQDLNENFAEIAAAIQDLESRVDTLSTPTRLMYSPGSAQTLTASSWGAVTWGNQIADDGGTQVVGAAIQPVEPGSYVVSAQVASDNWQGGQPLLQLVGLGAGTDWPNAISIGSQWGNAQVRATWVVRVEPGDTFEVRVNPFNASAAVLIDQDPSKTFLEAVRVGL